MCCMIIYRPLDAKGTVTRSTLEHCASENPHGLGLMWTHKGRLMTAHYSHAKRFEFYTRLLGLQKENIAFCAHFRLMTHGGESRGNTHPFWVHKGVSALMHNGIFHIKCAAGWSDTRTFVAQVLAPMPADWLDRPHLTYLINEATFGNRLAVMDRTGRVTLFHESSGTWDNGIWYANSGYKKSFLSDLFSSKKGDTGTTKALPPGGIIPATPNASGAPWIWSKDRQRWETPDGKCYTNTYPYGNGHDYGHKGAANGYGAYEKGRHNGNGNGGGNTGRSAATESERWEKVKGTDGITTWRRKTTDTVSVLYRWETTGGFAMTLCSDCLRTESTAEAEAVLIPDPAGMTCDLCEVQGHLADPGVATGA